MCRPSGLRLIAFGNGRRYTILGSCTDSSGNTSAKAATALVAKNQSGR